MQSIMLLLVWGVMVGIVFSAVGAAGGILASFGLITLIEITQPNTIKPMAQMITLAMTAVFIPGYMRRSACILPLGLLMGAGGIAGAWTGSTLSSLYLANMNVFRPLFGVLALLVAVQIFWRLRQQITARQWSISPQGVEAMAFSGGRLSFTYGQQAFSIAGWLPVVAGFLIALVAAIFGVGGGFLLVPFLATLLGLPMYVVPATAAIPIFISSSISIANYLYLGAEPDYSLLVYLSLGSMFGAMLGPHINRLSKESWLQGSLGIIVALIGFRYVLI